MPDAAAAAVVTTTLTAVTYNIHQAVGGDRRRDPRRILGVIGTLDADLVALQEVDAAPGPGTASLQMKALAGAGGYTAIAGPTIERHNCSYGNVLLTRLPVVSVFRIDLSRPGREPRGAIEARLRLPGGKRLRCIATHLGLSPRERRHQFAVLLSALAEDWGVPSLLMGDFNQWLPFWGGSRNLDRLFGRAPWRRTFPALVPLLPIDRIWIYPPDLLMDIRPLSTPLTRLASDHLPLVARLRYPAPRDTGRRSNRSSGRLCLL
ncbi:MAG: endonuclease/exonuclease/phosphatase family protein [Chromatiaceae bacterium]|jgi:endonuclease/exonuclease/phosphatase family metal-dependent hydrolase